MKRKNPEVFKAYGDKVVTVTVKIGVGKDASEDLIIRNAAEALRHYANSKPQQFSSWCREIEVI